MKRTPLVGQRFGRWLAIEEELDTKKKHTVLCQCDCGTKRSILAQNLKNGGSKSCGCYKREKNSRAMQEFWAAGRNHYGELK